MKRVLLLDIGNTRIKWALAHGGRRSRQQAVTHHGDWRVATHGSLARAVATADCCWCVSVAAAELTRALMLQLRRAGLVVRILRSVRSHHDLINGYREPWRLGADRWAAMLGARAGGFGRKALLVVSAGTALTVDLIDPHGRHCGGVIVPGPGLMTASLLADTAGIARRARGSRPTAARRKIFASDTRSALQSGTRLAAAALIDKLRVEARRKLGHDPIVLLTGGDAATLAQQLTCKSKLLPDLVLRGLAAALL
jgi:type III pantothenate kinase